MAERSRVVTRCPECRTVIGPVTGIDVYKHAVACLHVPDKGREQVLQLHRGKEELHSRRVVELLESVESEG